MTLNDVQMKIKTLKKKFQYYEAESKHRKKLLEQVDRFDSCAGCVSNVMGENLAQYNLIS